MSAGTVLHVERTDDPAVLRWVAHLDVANGRRVPGDDSALAAFVADGSITDVTVIAGAVLVRTPDPSRWAALAAGVHAALVADLRGRPRWLADASTVPPDPPSVAAVQATVDGAVGALAALHGGRIEVLTVDGARVVVRLHGACRGCAGAEGTLQRTAREAVLRAHPTVASVVEDPEGRGSPGRLSLRRSRY